MCNCQKRQQTNTETKIMIVVLQCLYRPLQHMILSSAAMHLITVCNGSRYGPDCNETCGQCADDEECNKTTGYCTACKPGWTLPRCHERKSKEIFVIGNS